VIWVSWRQQRTETIVTAAILVLLAAVLVPTGLQMASAYHHDGLSGCSAYANSFACGAALQSFVGRFAQISSLGGWLTLLPGLIGVLLAAPFVMQLESGAYRLDWTQSVTRRRWIAGKLALAIAAAVVASVVFIELVTWWRTPWVHLYGRYQDGTFDSEGIVAIGYTLFALALGLAVGVVWRRAVPALIVAFVGYFAARIFVDTWLRQRLIAPETLTWHPVNSQPAILAHAWVISMGPSDKLGHYLHPQLGICRGGAPGSVCVNPGGPAAYMHAVFMPADRFWSLQLAELAVFGGVALVLIAFAVWWTARRV
jgi:hypothetical protein